MTIPRNLGNLASGADANGVLQIAKGGTSATSNANTAFALKGSNSDITSLSGLSGNVSFTGTGNRITGDFSNVTFANRVVIQTSTVNGNTFIGAMPNGTGDRSGFLAHSSSDINNASFLAISPIPTESRVISGVNGTGTFLPITFYTNTAERLRIDTSGNVGVGTSSPLTNLTVVTPSTSIPVLIRGGSAFGADNGGGIAFATSSSSAITSVANAATAIRSLNAFGSESNGEQGSLAFYTNDRTGTNTYTGLLERMRITSSGNVGIGTSSPSTKLHVYTGSATDTSITIENTLGAFKLNKYSDGSTSVETTGAYAQRFFTNGNERMRITSSGGISFGSSGTAFGTTGQVLTSNGDAPPTWAAAGGGDFKFIQEITPTNGTSSLEIKELPEYKTYFLTFTDLVVSAVTGSFLIQFGSGGSTPTYITSGYAWCAIRSDSSSGTVNRGAGSSDPNMLIQFNSSSTKFPGGSIHFYGFRNSGGAKASLSGIASMENQGGISVFTGSVNIASSPITAIKISPGDSRTFTGTGTFRLYGVN